MLHFNEIEFESRSKKLENSMLEAKLDAMLLFSPESQYWLTGFDTFGYCFFQCLVIFKGKKILLTRSADLLQAKLTSNISDIRIWKDGLDAMPGKELLKIIEEIGMKGKRLGIELDTHGLTAYNFNMIKENLDNKLIDCSDIISKLRLIKSKEEIKYIRRAAEIADKCLISVRHLLKPNVKEQDILAIMQAENFKLGGDYPANEFIVGSGDYALLCRYQAGKRTLSKNDQITLEWAGVFKHYHVAMMRTAVIGELSDRHLKMHEAAKEALIECEKNLIPGKTMSEVFNSHRKVLIDYGFEHAKLNACGYALGARFSPSWMEREMFYNQAPTVIKQNMVFFLHMILMDDLSKLAMCLGQTYLVTSSNPECLSKIDLNLINV